MDSREARDSARFAERGCLRLSPRADVGHPCGASNNRVERLVRIAYGCRDTDTMIGLVMLFCSSIEIPWPGRKQKESTNKGPVTAQTA